MSKEELNFPRGKVALPSTSRERVPKRKTPEDLFKVLNGVKKKRAMKKKSKESTKDLQEDSEEFIVEPLTHKTIQPGMVLLGIVHYVQEMNLRIALPGCVAQLPLNQLSQSLNSLIQRWQHNPPEAKRRGLDGPPHPEKLMPLDAMYKVGHIMKVVVLNKTTETITVSAMCKEVNGNYKRESLQEGMVLQAAIASVEDYGYSIELGLDGLAMAFVSADKFPGVMYVGQVFLVRVIKNHGGRLKFVPYNFEDVVKTNDWNLNTITPGMVAEGTVIQNDENGLGLALFGGEVMGCVEPRQIVPGEDVSVNSKIRVAVMYTHPILNTVYCTMRVPPVDPVNPLKKFHGIVLGQLIKKAVVVQVTSTFVKLQIPIKNSGSTINAVAAKLNVSDDEAVDPGDIFSVGQVVPCRVIGMSLFEGELYVSLRHSVVVEGCYYTEDDLYVGRTLPAKVKYTNDTGIVFELCPGVIAFCDFTEASFVVNKTNVAEMYPVGKPVWVAIRYINGKHYPPRYFVTCNKQLIKSKHDVIQKYDEENIGKLSDGVVLMKKRTGLLVGFYNKVRGWVPEQHLPHSASRPDEVYRVGQVVTAKVLNVTVEASRMTLSLRYVDLHPSSTDEAVEVSDNKRKFSFEPKTNIEALVIGKDKHGLEVRAEGFGKCLIPEEHLSDFSDLSKLLLQRINVGSKLEGLTSFGTVGGATILSMKPHVGTMFANNGDSEVVNIAKDSILPGVVKSVAKWGVAVSLPNDFSAKLLTRDLSDAFIPKDQLSITEGSTLICKLTSAGEPFTATSKKSAVNYSVDSSCNESLSKTMKKLLSFDADDSIGRVVKVVPQELDSEIVCDYKGQRALANLALTTEGQAVNEQPTNAIILGYRFNEGRREYVVTIDRDIVYKYLQFVRQSKKNSRKVHVRCKSDVLLLAVLKDYAVAITKDGLLLFLTLGKHFNDVRRTEWSLLPRFVKAYVYEKVSGGIAVGNFLRSDSVPTIDTHVVTKFDKGLSSTAASRKALDFIREILTESLLTDRGLEGPDTTDEENADIDGDIDGDNADIDDDDHEENADAEDTHDDEDSTESDDDETANDWDEEMHTSDFDSNESVPDLSVSEFLQRLHRELA